MDRNRDFPTSGKAGTAARLQRVLLAFCLSILLMPAAAADDFDSHTYRLEPGDRITVTVFGQPELSGDVPVDGAGSITIPLISPVQVRGLTVLECQKRIVEQLRADGILRTPSVSVRISELRPLYVLGDVRLPGGYPFRYGSVAQSAVALAGGYGPVEALRQTAISEYLQAEERVRQLTLQNRTLLVREARLKAQRDGTDGFSPPEFADAVDDKETAAIVANEKEIFLTQSSTLRGQIDLLHSQTPLLKQQIDSNNEQGEAGRKQLDLIQQQITRYGNLLRQGLGLQNNEFQYRILEANQEAANSRVMSEVSRLQVESGNIDLKIEEVKAIFKREATKELQETRDRLNELEVTLPAAIRIRDVKLQYAGGAAAQGVKHLISITRLRNGRPVVLDADETTPLEPGDVIEIKNNLPSMLGHPEADAAPLTLRSASR